MPDRVITAEALITAKDGTGDTFAKIASKLQGLGKGAKASVEIDKLNAALERHQSQLRALDKLQVTRAKFADTRATFNAQRLAVEQAAKALAGAAKPTRELETALTRARTAVSRSAADFEKQKTAMLDAKRAAESFGSPLVKIASEQARLRSSIESTTSAIQKQAAAEAHAAEAATRAAASHRALEHAAEKRAHGIAHHGVGNYILGGAAAAVSAHGIFRGAESAMEAGAERQHVITGMRTAGMPMEEVERAQILAGRMAKEAPNLSATQIMELHKEARSAVQHPEEVFELMPALAKATSVLKGMGSTDANIADLVKGGESLGLMNDPKRFHAYLEGQVKAMAVMGKTITTSQTYEAAKYSKSAGSTLSDDFLNLVMPSLIQEMHGSSAGEALAKLSKTVRGGLQHMHLPVERLNELGMLEDPKKIKRSKTGQIMGYKGKVVGEDVLASDPDKFAKIFSDHMEKHGITKLADKVKVLQETLPGTAADLIRILIQRSQRNRWRCGGQRPWPCCGRRPRRHPWRRPRRIRCARLRSPRRESAALPGLRRDVPVCRGRRRSDERRPFVDERSLRHALTT